MNEPSHDVEPLIGFLKRVPSVSRRVAGGVFEGNLWWVKFSIDLAHPLAWSAVQNLGYVLNYLSLNDRLPTVFMPVSPPPYLNGGPTQFLSWVIESTSADFSPALCLEWLESRLPKPVEDATQWDFDGDNEDEEGET